MISTKHLQINYTFRHEEIAIKTNLGNSTFSKGQMTVNFTKELYPVGIYLLIMNNRNTRTRCEHVIADWDKGTFQRFI